mgnify:CR=1 FL=1
MIFGHLSRNGQEFSLKFKHTGKSQRRTFCELKLYTDENIEPYIFKSDVGCHSSDNFCKEDGRKKALKKLFTTGMFIKQDRRDIWNAYHDRAN